MASISATAPVGQIGLNTRVARMGKPSAGASNKGRPEGDFIGKFLINVVNVLTLLVMNVVQYCHYS